jgi:hypothetical protein
MPWLPGSPARRSATDSGDIFYFTQLEQEPSACDLFLTERFHIPFTRKTEALLPVDPNRYVSS